MNGSDRQSGFALVLVLWALVFLAVLATNLASGVRVQAKVTRNQVDQLQAYYAARAGIQVGMARILQREQYVARHPARVSAAQRSRASWNRGANSNLHPLEVEENGDEEVSELWKVDGRPNPMDYDNSTLNVFITQENGKIDLNNSNPIILRNLLGLCGLEQQDVDIIVDSIADWRDGDNLHRENGAEEEYYKTLNPPYRPRNADFTSVEELLRVRGMSADLLFALLPEQEGTTTGGKNGKTAKDQANQDDEQNPPPRLRLIDCLTVHNKGGRIDLRYAPEAVIRSLPLASEGIADRIIEARDKAGGETLSADTVRTAVGDTIYNGLQGYVSMAETGGSTGNTFSIEAQATTESGFLAKVKALVEVAPGGTRPARIVKWIDWAS